MQFPIISFFHFYFHFSAGKIELFTKHDHTQYRLLATVDDPAPVTDLNYISLASNNDTPIQLYYNCKLTPSYIDTQLATKYTAVGHPLLLDDPPFVTHVDKRNCKFKCV